MQQVFKGDVTHLDIVLDNLRGFLDTVMLGISKKVGEVSQKNEVRGYEEEGDYDEPLMYEEIVARSIYYELNALIESELQYSAFKPWVNSPRYSGPKSIFDLKDWSKRSLRTLQTVNDLSYSELKRLIEQEYQIRIEGLDAYSIVSEIRERVNSLKHRFGSTDFRKTRTMEQYELNPTMAYEAIEKTRTFIHALWKATNRSTS